MAPAPMNTRWSWDLPGSGRRRPIYDGELGARVESVNGRFVRLHIHSTFPKPILYAGLAHLVIPELLPRK